jgi:hypothetical protein
VICEGCGLKAPALKTCRWRTGDRRFTLCDSCWEPLISSVWIVAGRVPAHGKCGVCGGWFSLRDLLEISPGGKYDAPSGICSECVRE